MLEEESLTRSRTEIGMHGAEQQSKKSTEGQAGTHEGR